MSSMFSSQDQFCPFWDHFCGFAYIIRLGDHFCLGVIFAVVFAVVQGSWLGKTHRFCLDKRLWDVQGVGAGGQLTYFLGGYVCRMTHNWGNIL